MKRTGRIFTLAVLSGLLVFSQALAIEQTSRSNAQRSGALSGEELRQWNLDQERIETRDQLRLASQVLDRAQTHEMQRLLTQQGYWISSVNGVMNFETSEALRRFQESQGLTVTGMPDQGTLRALAPSASQQEFFGLSPAYGDWEE